LRLAGLPVRIRDGEVTPRFLGEDDLGWIGAVVDLALAHVGAPWRELEASLARPVAVKVSMRRQRLVSLVLRQMLRRRVQSPVQPRRARALLFGMAVNGGDREAIVANAAAQLGIAPDDLEAAIFADLPPERRVLAPDSVPSPGELATLSNLQLCQILLTRAIEVQIRLVDGARPLVRWAQRCGLLCTALRGPTAGEVVLQLSGPLSLFRRTTRYGRALGSMLGGLAGCRQFELIATLALGDGEVDLRLRTGDPFLLAGQEWQTDRVVERRLARDLEREVSGLVAVREPEPVTAGASLMFPDFLLIDREDPARRWALEVLGFWTPRYIEDRSRRYREAGLEGVILCVDDRLRCADGELPPGVHLVRYRGRVPAREVLRLCVT
jgi:predicted nuclease of restriction endonuclease-like RecB superfamily